MLNLFLQVSPFPFPYRGVVEAEEYLNIAVGIFAVLLMLLSLLAYRRSSLSRLLFVSLAFGLFAVEVLIRHLDIFVFGVAPFADQFLSIILDFLILLFFFLALVVEK